MTFMQILEMLSLLVTIFGLPLAIFVFVFEQRKARVNEEEEIYQMLADGYTNFLTLSLDHSDLHLQSEHPTTNLNDEQRDRLLAMFAILIALFERAYMVAYEPDMPARRQRRWASWEDFMREWCRRDDFRSSLPRLLPGEDPEFAVYISRLAQEEAARGSS
ncbi:hypothetical protein [Mesorhizobium sp. ANAO-SY3R2]|uniref:hypothetical protein n=1 Tax=Mesorhizobium sp. ANAO-SY3R2 TaxID=3166644 RepID=UPI003670D78F